MAECPGSRSNRGTRSQFRIRAPSLLNGPYSVHLGDIMDIGQSSQTGILSTSDIVSSNKGTRTRTVREYEQTISELKKENFDLKLRVFLCEEAIKKHPPKNKDCSSPEEQNSIQVIVQLKLEAESLRNELSHREELLQDALNRAEACETDFKELEKKFAELQCQLSLLSELPSKQEFQFLLDEKESLLNQNHALQKTIIEKDEENQVLNEKIEIICSQNRILEEKINTKSLAIQGFVYKNYKEKELLPDELRNIVISATQAAKNRNEKDLAIAVKNFSTALNQMICSSTFEADNLNKSTEKDSVGQLHAKCLNEEDLSQSGSILSNQSESSKLHCVQSPKEVDSERHVPEAKSLTNLEDIFADSYLRKSCDNSVNIIERNIIDSSATPSKADRTNISPLSNAPDNACSHHANHVINIETFDSTVKDIDSLKDNSASNNASEIPLKLQNALKENEQLKLSSEEKLAVIRDLRANCEELEQKYPEVQSAVSQISEYSSVHTQTEVAGCSLLQLQEMSQLEKDARISDNIDGLREDVLLLLLTIESKNKELTDVKETLSSVQKDLKQALSNNKVISGSDMDFESERKELHERLAFSYSINDKLMRHLQNLELFMENLLQHKLDSSVESINEKSDIFSSVSKCLNESLKLSHALSDHLSICEGSKLFQDSESFFNKNDTLSDNRSIFQLDTSEFNLLDHSAMSVRRNVQEGFFSHLNKNEVQGTGKQIFESLLIPGDQVCSRCWEQINCDDKPDFSHSIQNNNVHLKTVGYLSSDSDIWSEPDRDVSMQRIGICLKNSPFTSKSPRRNRLKDRKISKLNPEWNTSSTDKHNASRQRRNGSLSHRLFDKESTRIEEFPYEKFYNMLSEKFSTLNSILNKLEHVCSIKPNKEIWNKLTAVVTSVGETLQKLKVAKEYTKSFSPAECEKCSVLDLLVELRTFYNEIIPGKPYILGENEIKDLQKFKVEINSLKQECEKLLCLSDQNEMDNLKQRLLELSSEKKIRVNKLSTATQCQLSIKTDQTEIKALEQNILDVNNENTALKKKMNKIEESISGERSLFDSIKRENVELSNEVSHLKDHVLLLEQKEKELLKQIDEYNKKCSDKSDQSEIEMLRQKILNLNHENDVLIENLSKFKTSLSEERSLHDLVKTKNTELSNKVNYLKEQLVLLEQKEQELLLQIDKLNEKYSGETDQIDIEILKQRISNLSHENATLNEKLSKLKESVLEERSLYDSVKIENAELSNKVSQLKEQLLLFEQKEQELLLQNTELCEKCSILNKDNVELNCILKNIEQSRKESNKAFNQLTEELHQKKLDLITLNAKCLEYEKELQVQVKLNDSFAEKYKDLQHWSSSEKEKYLNKIKILNLEKDGCNEMLKNSQVKIHALENENVILKAKLEENGKECCMLKEIIDKLQNQKENLNITCRDLQIELDVIKQQLINLKEKCAAYEREDASKCKTQDLCRELKQQELLSKYEKQKLLDEISHLISERDDVLQKTKDEREFTDRLLKEKAEINKKLDECYKVISSLKFSNEEMEVAQSNMSKTNELVQGALTSSSSKCDALSKDLKTMRETLKNLESKCLEYEKELAATTGIKDSLVQCLININNEFAVNSHKLNELYKLYGHANKLEEQLNIDIPKIEDCSIKDLCDEIMLQSSKLLEMADTLMAFFKDFHIKSQEVLKEEEITKRKWDCLRKQIDAQSIEAEYLKSKNSHLERTLDDLQKSIAQKEKSVQSLKERLCIAENEVEYEKSVLKTKVNEITNLQERLFDLQAYINNIVAEKAKLQSQSSSCQAVNHEKADSFLQPVVDLDNSNRTLNDSLDSVNSAIESNKNSCCGKFWKKYHSLKTKLVLCERRVEILEKEKNDLRESFMSQLQARQDDFDGKDSLIAKILELESKLEQKKVFIRELKNELLKTCNSLMNKEKEIDDLKLKLSQSEKKSQVKDSGLSELQSKVKPQDVEMNIKNLNSYKWELIQMIFNLQRKFYEKKGIHLDYFEKFRDHVENLYFTHLKNPISKCKSMPLIWSQKMQEVYIDKDDKLKYLLSLELDIQCLENLKIFLNRFLAPYVLDHSDVNEMKFSEESEFLKVPVVAGTFERKTVEIPVRLESSDLIEFSYNVPATLKSMSEKNCSFEKYAVSVSQNIDYIENFFNTAESQCLQLNNLEFSSDESNLKVEVKTLLEKIFKEIKALHGETDKLFKANAALKNLDLLKSFIPVVSSKPDISDHESVMSEETITISRSITPTSVDDICPVKLPLSETSKKEVRPQSLTDKAVINDPYGSKLVAVSSCDSVCQRSHYSSPDLGIESDPNHDSSAPEQKEDAHRKYQKGIILQEPKSAAKPKSKAAFTSTDSSTKWRGTKFPGGSLYCIGNLQQYELLKREVQESLVGIKSVLSRTGEGLPRIAKYTSPRKTLEYNTLKAIKDTCANIEVCLKEAYRLVGEFWIAACPTEEEWNALTDENRHLYEQLSNLKIIMHKQENDFKKAKEKLETAQTLQASMDRKLSKKLIKTKRVIRQAEVKLLENEFQNFPLLSRYPAEQSSSLHNS